MDSISEPFWDDWFVITETEPVSLFGLILPANENEEAPLPSSPSVTM